MAKKNELFTVKTPRALGCYVTLAKPRAMEEGKDPEYSVSLLWPKTANLDEVRAAIDAAASEKWGPNGPKLLGGKLKTPLKDGNAKTDDEGNVDPIYKDKWCINARSRQRVRLVNHELVDIDPSEVYSGCFFQAQLRFYTYEYKGPTGKGPVQSRGVGCGLQNIMLVGRGPRIDGRETAESAFKDFTPDVGDADGFEGGDDLSDLGI